MQEKLKKVQRSLEILKKTLKENLEPLSKENIIDIIDEIIKIILD